MATKGSGSSSMACGAVHRQTPEAGARCVNRARRDLCGGYPVTGIPTATYIGSLQVPSPSGSSWDQDDYRSKLVIVFKAGMPSYLNQPEMQSYNVILPYQLKA